MKKINGKRLDEAFFIVISLFIAFVANKWFEQAWTLNTIGKWSSVIIALVILIITVYKALPDKK